MILNKQSWVGLLVVLAGCAGGSGTASQGATVASLESQAYGIAGYRMDASRVVLLDAAGAELGTLTVEAGDQSRLVRIIIGDAMYENEVTRPVAGQFYAPMHDSREGAVQLDPALAGYFAGYQVHFQAARTDGPNTLAVETTALCTAITFASGCSPYRCVSQNSYVNQWEEVVSYATDCYTACGPSAYVEGENDYGTSHGCLCISYSSDATEEARCTPNGHGCSQYDVVSKSRYCSDPGSCSNVANGFLRCNS